MQRLILNQDDNDLCVGSLCTGNGIPGLLEEGWVVGFSLVPQWVTMNHHFVPALSIFVHH